MRSLLVADVMIKNLTEEPLHQSRQTGGGFLWGGSVSKCHHALQHDRKRAVGAPGGPQSGERSAVQALVGLAGSPAASQGGNLSANS